MFCTENYTDLLLKFPSAVQQSCMNVIVRVVIIHDKKMVNQVYIL